jgi:hypothetical protein
MAMAAAAAPRAMRLLGAALCVLLLAGAGLVADAAKAGKPLPQRNVKQAPRKDLSKRMERLNTVDMMIAVRELFCFRVLGGGGAEGRALFVDASVGHARAILKIRLFYSNQLNK